jgi:hypothetical protein
MLQYAYLKLPLGDAAMSNLAPIVAVLAFILGVVNFVVTLRLTARRDTGAIRPVLVFIYRKEGWHVENAGNGPALDVIFHRLSGDSPSQNVRLPALGKGAEILLHFARHDGKQLFAVTYRDVEGRAYTTRSQHDVATVGMGFSVSRPHDPAKLDRWWNLPDSNGHGSRRLPS